MTETVTNARDFIGYEYRDVSVRREMEPAYLDAYENFGWTLEKETLTFGNLAEITLKLKRDRKIVNKPELTRLQKQFENSMKEIETMERSKTLNASTAAYIVGIVGTAFMAGSVFAVVGQMTLLCIILAIPAFALWGLGYFSYVKIKQKRTEKLDPLIEQKYDEIYEVCEKANSLIS